MATKKDNPEHESHFSQWKELGLLYAGKILQEIADGLFGKIRAGVERAVSNAMRKIIVLFLLLLGVVLIGLSGVHMVNELTGTSWAGYGSLGFLFILISMIISLATKDKKE